MNFNSNDALCIPTLNILKGSLNKLTGGIFLKTAIIALNDYSQVKGGTEVFTKHLQTVFPESTVVSAPQNVGQVFEKIGFQNEYRSWKAGKKFLNINDQFDAVFRNSYAGWNVKTESPLINVFHFTYYGFSQEAMQGSKGHFQAKYISPFFEKLCLNNGVNIAVSSKVQRELKKYYKTESRVIENAVPDIFHNIPKEKARKEIGIDYSGPLGIFVGRTDQTKGFDIVLKISKNIKIICVTPSDRQSTDNILVRTNVEYENMPKYYSAADFLIFPSRYESSGYSVMEAIKCGIPVVASKTGILEDIDPNEVGAIVDIDDYEGYVKGVKQVIKSNFTPSSEISKRFSMERFKKEYFDLVKEVGEL